MPKTAAWKSSWFFGFELAGRCNFDGFNGQTGNSHLPCSSWHHIEFFRSFYTLSSHQMGFQENSECQEPVFQSRLPVGAGVFTSQPTDQAGDSPVFPVWTRSVSPLDGTKGARSESECNQCARLSTFFFSLPLQFLRPGFMHSPCPKT